MIALSKLAKPGQRHTFGANQDDACGFGCTLSQMVLNSVWAALILTPRVKMVSL